MTVRVGNLVGETIGKVAALRLSNDAQAMRKMVEEAGARFAHRRMGTLEVVLERRQDERWRLAAARGDVAPPDEELAALAAAFMAPAGCEWGAAVRRENGGRVLFVREVFWREA
jgi:hypothetical protein